MTALTRRELAALADAWDHDAHEQALAAEALRAVGEHRPAWVGDGRVRQLEECAAQLRAAIALPDVCACTHPAVMHTIRADKSRGACSVSEGPKGTPCGCRRYQRREET